MSRCSDASWQIELVAVLRLKLGLCWGWGKHRHRCLSTSSLPIWDAGVAVTAANDQSAGVEIPRYRCTPSKDEAYAAH